jgi:formate/nitrite transporter FocA (FNT family)
MASKEGFNEQEQHEIEAVQPIRAPVIFEAIRRQGKEELDRPVSSLALSGLVAGITLGLSVLSEAILRSMLPDVGWRPLVENLGYSIGFLAVILGQMQLFTENTITAVCPVLDEPRLAVWGRLFRLWSIVFSTNILGAILFAWVLPLSGALSPEVKAAFLELSEHALSFSWNETMLRGIGAGWLIATLVWVMPNAHDGKVAIIILITYLIALADFSHVIAGTTEAATLVIAGQLSAWDAGWNFVLPALIGNVIGGTVLFTLLTWGQIRTELPKGRD